MSTDVTPVQWAELSVEQKNQLIATKVMGQEPLCSGRLTYGATDALFQQQVSVCLECNALVTSGRGQQLPAQHTRSVANYSQSLDALKTLRLHMAERSSLLNLHLIVYAYNRCYASFSLEAPTDDREWSEGNGEHCMEDAICIAALRAVGVEVQS